MPSSLRLHLRKYMLLLVQNLVNLKVQIMIMEKAVYGTKTAALRFHEALSIRL